MLLYYKIIILNILITSITTIIDILDFSGHLPGPNLRFPVVIRNTRLLIGS